MATPADPVLDSLSTGLPELLSLERIEDDMFRSVVVSPDRAGLFGGQVAAQALRAAAETVPAGRHPHSLHGYFLSRGDASRRVPPTVSRDRDGGSYFHRPAVAGPNGGVNFQPAAALPLQRGGSRSPTHAPP